MESRYALKYINGLDEFVKIGILPASDIFRGVEIAGMDGETYKKLVVERTIFNVNPGLKKRVDSKDHYVFEDLYTQAVDINNDLNHENLSITSREGNNAYVESSDSEAPFVPKIHITPIDREYKSPSEVIGEFRKRLEEEVRGQPQIVEPLTDTMEDYLSGLRDEQRPIGNYLFLGPTGVGKTLTAKVISGLMFDGRMVRVDCPEYALPHEIAKLIGSPPGYVGHKKGGYLTDALKGDLNSVVLFDEVEKAHSNLHNIILRMLDEGVITDSKGFAVDGSNALILMTSNAGGNIWDEFKKTDEYRKMDPVTREGRRVDLYLEAARQEFRPEFRGRLDDIIVYNEFNLETASQVAGSVINNLTNPFPKKHGVNINWTDEVVRFIAEVSDYKKYGGRDMVRPIKSAIKRPLRRMLLNGKLNNGDTVEIFYNDELHNKLSFEVNRKGKHKSRQKETEQ
jgi:ATP-dependent Clp protease ATP-binding subunit ClpB